MLPCHRLALHNMFLAFDCILDGFSLCDPLEGCVVRLAQPHADLEGELLLEDGLLLRDGRQLLQPLLQDHGRQRLLPNLEYSEGKIDHARVIFLRTLVCNMHICNITSTLRREWQVLRKGKIR